MSLNWHREKAVNIYTGLLFQQGYIQDPDLALSLAGVEADKESQTPEPARVPKHESEGRRATFRSHAISSICCTTALSPFR
jgi:hypothetical protein